MSDLLPPNSSPLEDALVNAIDAALSNVPVNVRDVWSVEECPVDLLPWLAWAFSVDTWRDDWPEHIKRGVIRASVATHKIKGTRKAVANVVESFGGDIVIIENFEKQLRGVPHTFEILVSYGGASVEAVLQEALVASVSAAKPERSKFTVSTAVEFEESLGITGFCRVTEFVRLEFS